MFENLPIWYDSWHEENPDEVRQEQLYLHERKWEIEADIADIRD